MLEPDIAVQLQFFSFPLILGGLTLLITEILSPMTACRLVERSSRQLDRMTPTSDAVLSWITPGTKPANGKFQLFSLSAVSLLLFSTAMPGVPTSVDLLSQLVFAVFFSGAVMVLCHFLYRQLLRLTNRYSISALGVLMIATAGVLELLQLAAAAQIGLHQTPLAELTLSQPTAYAGVVYAYSVLVMLGYVGVTLVSLKIGDLLRTQLQWSATLEDKLDWTDKREES